MIATLPQKTDVKLVMPTVSLSNMTTIKATLRVPTKDPYAYIETVIDGTPEHVIATYEDLTALVKSGDKANHNDFYKFLQIIVDSDFKVWGSADDYQALNPAQQEVMQSLKRFTKRKANE